MLTYERLQYKQKVVTHPDALDSAIEKLVSDFYNGTCARGVVYDTDTNNAYVVVENDKIEVPCNYSIVEIEKEEDYV